MSRDENNKIYFHKNSGRGLGSQEKRWLDLGTIPNLLIKTVGQIIRAENNVLIGGEGSGLGQGGRWHCNWSFLDDGRGGVQGILRLLLGLVSCQGRELEAGLQVCFVNGEVDVIIGGDSGDLRLL